MMRDSALTSLSLDSLSHGAERLFWRLILVADDYGRFNADPRVLLAKCFPLKIGTFKVADVTKWWRELVEAGTVKPYQAGDRLYGYFPSWFDHQRRRDSKSRFPDPSIGGLSASCGELPQDAAIGGSRTRAVGVEDVVEDEAGAGVGVTVPPAAGLPATLVERIPELRTWPSVEALVAWWNYTATADGLPSVETISTARRERARKALRQFPEWRFWNGALSRIKVSKFLTGKVSPANGHSKPFRADFDWLLASKDGVENVVRLHDGRYDG